MTDESNMKERVAAEGEVLKLVSEAIRDKKSIYIAISDGHAGANIIYGSIFDLHGSICTAVETHPHVRELFKSLLPKLMFALHEGYKKEMTEEPEATDKPFDKNFTDV